MNDPETQKDKEKKENKNQKPQVSKNIVCPVLRWRIWKYADDSNHSKFLLML